MSERRDIEIPVRELPIDRLSPEDQELVAKAKEIVSDAYAPYSHFHVAAALRLESGRVVLGTNQENASYPSDYVPSGPPSSSRAPSIPTIPSLR